MTLPNLHHPCYDPGRWLTIWSEEEITEDAGTDASIHILSFAINGYSQDVDKSLGQVIQGLNLFVSTRPQLYPFILVVVGEVVDTHITPQARFRTQELIDQARKQCIVEVLEVDDDHYKSATTYAQQTLPFELTDTMVLSFHL